MSDIYIHNMTERAKARIGRIEQVRALAPYPVKHAGDHWQLNHRSGKSQRVPTGERREPWPAMRNQPLFIGVRGSPNSTVTKSIRIPFTAIITEIGIEANGGSTNGVLELNVAISNQGTVWHEELTNFQHTHQSTVNAVVTTRKWSPGIIILSPGSELTITVVTPNTSDSYFTAIINPYTQG